LGAVIGFTAAGALACVLRTTHPAAPGNWDVPSADVAASGNPLRSVGERSDDNARRHHLGLAAEVAAADQKRVCNS
jgi:hypothetical protein